VEALEEDQVGRYLALLEVPFRVSLYIFRVLFPQQSYRADVVLTFFFIIEAVGTTNIALNRPAAQSSDAYGGTAGRAVDGNDSPQWADGSCTHTVNGPNPWWRVDLGSSQAVGRVVVTNRKDCCSDRLEGFTVYVGDSPEVLSNPTCGGPQSVAGRGTITVSCGGLRGRYVGIALKGAQRTLTLCEVKVFGGTSASGPLLFVDLF